MDNIYISLITVCFNSEATIERTIKSVLEQSYISFEYIIVDGGSSDNTVGIIRKYEPKFNGRMKWISEKDNGIYDAMNKGIQLSTGDLIGLVNSDDWLEHDALEKVYDRYTINNSDNDTLYCGDIYYHYVDGRIREWKVNLETFKKQTKLYVMAGIRHPAVYVPRQVYSKIGLFNDQMHLSADQDFILRCYYGGMKFKKIGCVLSNMSEGGISTADTEKARRISMEDRRIMLKSFGIEGLTYWWLWYSWRIRNYIKKLIQSFI